MVALLSFQASSPSASHKAGGASRSATVVQGSPSKRATADLRDLDTLQKQMRSKRCWTRTAKKTHVAELCQQPKRTQKHATIRHTCLGRAPVSPEPSLVRIAFDWPRLGGCITLQLRAPRVHDAQKMIGEQDDFRRFVGIVERHIAMRVRIFVGADCTGKKVTKPLLLTALSRPVSERSMFKSERCPH